MTEPLQVRAPPRKPLIVFDGDCNFCRHWIARWQHWTGDNVDYMPYQDAALGTLFPELGRARCEEAVQLIETNGAVYSGAEAVFRSLSYSRRHRQLIRLYGHIPAFAPVAEGAYRFVASHRRIFSAATRMLWGREFVPSDYRLVRSSLVRLLGLIYLVAFLSLWSQLMGLIGERGILPAAEMMSSVRQQVEQQQIGWSRYNLLPTLCWFGASDWFLNLLCATGVALSIATVLGFAPRVSLCGLWTIYLSLTTVCREFLSFQWDNLLLETGLLGMLFAPGNLFPRNFNTPLSSRLPLWLLRWLLFRLMFESGCVKLLSGDPAWRDLTALNVHYETQPLPTWIGWYAHQLPPLFHQVSVLLMFVTELAVPFLIFGPRQIRLFACVATIGFELLILLTGNYGFFNLLAIALAVTLLDDAALGKLLPKRLRRSPALSPAETAGSRKPEGEAASFGLRRRQILASVRKVALVLMSILILTITTIELLGLLRVRLPLPRAAGALFNIVGPFRSMNSYGLFAVMTTSRPEIVVEGSNDAQNWVAYEFKYKPGDLSGRPRFVISHMPRLDWQMWFAALGTHRDNPWFVQFCRRLLEGSPEVMDLLKHNPFPKEPPRYIRAQVFDYRFTNVGSKSQTGSWWQRKFLRAYCPVLSVRNR